jgi:hypothetical protein
MMNEVTFSIGDEPTFPTDHMVTVRDMFSHRGGHVVLTQAQHDALVGQVVWFDAKE